VLTLTLRKVRLYIAVTLGRQLEPVNNNKSVCNQVRNTCLTIQMQYVEFLEIS
jgi:hypothetical protein